MRTHLKLRYYLILILLAFSLLWNLWLYPLYLEEPRRAVVSLEMVLSGNYIVPTIMGELYFAKPPLFNWILILSSKVFSGFSEFSVRFPTVLSLLILSFLHFLITKKFLGREIAFFSSLAFITSANILFYFSLLGEIDIFYSLIIYLLIASIFWFYKKNSHLLFIFPFLFASFGFLTKGFPSILFLYISLFSFLFFERRLRLLLSPFHIIGILIFFIPIGIYFFLYSLEYPLEEYLTFLWKESSQRTVLENQFRIFFFHLFEFPFKTLLATFPWSILIIFLFRKNVIKIVLNEPFLKFSSIVFLFNYAVYWLSPGANQRYIYMLFPFLLTVLVYFFFYEKSPFKHRTVKVFSVLILVLLSAISFFLPLSEKLRVLGLIFPVSVLFGFIFLILTVRVIKTNRTVYYLVISLLWFRLLFDIVYLPVKAKSGTSFLEKKFGIKTAQITDGKKLFFYGKDRVDYGLLFYIERERKDILKRNLSLEMENFYLSKPVYVKNIKEEIKKVLEFKTKKEYVLFYLNR